MIFCRDCDLITNEEVSDCSLCYRYDICYKWYLSCNDCINCYPHVSKCSNDKGMCIKFPYDMGSNTEFLYVNNGDTIENN